MAEGESFNLISWLVGALTTVVLALAALVRKVDVEEIHRRLDRLEGLEARLDAAERRLERLDEKGGRRESGD